MRPTLFALLAVLLLCSELQAQDRRGNLDPCAFMALKLGDNYKGEEKGESEEFPDSKVRYFRTEKQREKYKVQIKSGLLMLPDSKGKLKPLTTKGQKLGDSVLFSYDLKNILYANLQTMEGEIHHSTYTAGSDLKAAGTLQVLDGELVEVTNSSGHYKPEWQNIYLFLRDLQSQGVSFNKLTVELHWIPRHLHSRVTQILTKDFGLTVHQIKIYDHDPSAMRFHYNGGGGGLMF